VLAIQGDTNKAVFLSVVAFAAFSMSDALRKMQAADYPIADILFWQSALGILAIILCAPILGGVSSLWATKMLKWHIARGFFMGLNTILSLIVISQIPLMDAYTIFFLTPFVTALIFLFVLKEKIGLYSMLAILGGFIGIVIAFRPGFVDLHWAYFFALGCTISFSLIFVMVAMILYKGGSITFYDSFFFLICGAGGLFYALAVILIPYSYTLALASDIAPYQYIQLPFAIILGYFIFGDVPDLYKIAGALIIVGSGLFLFMRQRIKAKDLKA